VSHGLPAQSSSRREAGPRLTSLVSRRFLRHAARLAAHAQGMYPRPQAARQVGEHVGALSAPASCESTALHRDAATSQLWKNPERTDGGRNLGTWASFRGPPPNLWPVWYAKPKMGDQRATPPLALDSGRNSAGIRGKCLVAPRGTMLRWPR
jgi:hypothetical protein